MNYANMIEEKRLKKGYVLAILISTVIGTFSTGIGLYDRVKDRREQKRKDKGQDQKIEELEARLNQKMESKQIGNGNGNGNGNGGGGNGGGGGGGGQRRDREDDFRDSLEYSGPMIQREYDRHFARMGNRYAEGDLMAQTQIQSQIITLQSSVIKMLQEALFTGKLPDVNRLYNAAEFAREGSIRALQDQYQRMLQAAPVQRPGGLLRRISSTSALADPRGMRGSSPARKPQKALTFPQRAPLFCPYADDLQRTARPLHDSFRTGGTGTCPDCGSHIAVEEGRSWKIEKEVVLERRSSTEQIVETVEDRTYLIGNRFLIKCHREGTGYACYLCYRLRESDTLCETMESFMSHVSKQHSIREYESDPDIKEVLPTYR